MTGHFSLTIFIVHGVARALCIRSVSCTQSRNSRTLKRVHGGYRWIADRYGFVRKRIAAIRPLTPNLAYTRWRCFWTVLELMPNCRAITLLGSPVATASSTSRSRLVSPDSFPTETAGSGTVCTGRMIGAPSMLTLEEDGNKGKTDCKEILCKNILE